MKKSLMNKFTLKIISVFIAVFVWLLVVNIEDPVMTQTISNVSVEITNSTYIESMGKMPLVDEAKRNISVSVTGKRSVVDRLEAKDITAVADLQQIVDMDSDPIMVPITVSCPGITEDHIQARPQNIEIEIDQIKSMDFIVTPDAGSSKPGKGYELGRMTSDPDKITITGPASVMGKIDKVVAPISVEGLNEDTIIPSTIKIIDKNQDEMSESDVKSLKFADDQSSTVNVAVELWKTKSNIAIEADYSGKPASGYQVDVIESVPETITIAGTEEALQEFADNGNVLKIPADEVQLDGESADFEVKVDISKLLPEDIILATNENKIILLKVKILPLGSQEFSIPTTSIQVIKPGDMDVVFDSEKVTIRLKGRKKDLANFSESSIAATLDLSGYSPGEYEVPLTIQVPSQYQVVDEITVKLQLVKTAAEKSDG